MIDADLWEPASSSEPCAALDPVTRARCTKRAGLHLVHTDRSDPGLLVTWIGPPPPLPITS